MARTGFCDSKPLLDLHKKVDDRVPVRSWGNGCAPIDGWQSLGPDERLVVNVEVDVERKWGRPLSAQTRTDILLEFQEARRQCSVVDGSVVHPLYSLQALVPSLLRHEVEVALEKLGLIWDKSYALSTSIISRLSGVGSRGQQPKKRSPDFPLPSYFFQLIRRDPQAFPDQSRDIVSPTCPGSSRGSPPGGTCPEHLTRGHPNLMPKPPHLAPLNAEEQRLYSELLPDGRASHPISKGEPSHPTEEAHFSRLYL
ncbi:hypothetical protein D4764_12G0008660 [Takifugu flavidus]|uniref:Uncharacterized protein n=1 Tax=Takifugu flavidus TaxID=433684 RepID=A0A5C6PE80_9TELE|nr:hypothetical protein D4764_12G0008660 [Takifugu flavidus]